MDVKQQIDNYIDSQTEPKRTELRTFHTLVTDILTKPRLWFLDGKNAEGKVISNPNIGYGFQTIRYADGTTKEFYQIGISANTSGISVYILGLEDKTYLPNMYGEKIGKASVTGYCVKFKRLNEINLEVLKAAIRDGVATTGI